MTGRKESLQAFLRDIGWQDAARTHVAGDASNRRYERLTRPEGTRAILMDAPPERGEDTAPFIRIANWLRDTGLSAPEIHHGESDKGLLLIEDLGDDLFARLLSHDPAREATLYDAATDVLATLHDAPPPSLPPCDATWLTGMTDLFFDWYLPDDRPVTHGAFAGLFHPLAQSLDADAKVVILRDYHAENLLWLPERDGVARVGILDFQDALLGHRAYDLVSLLLDARRDTAPATQERMIDRYLQATGCNAGEFRRAYAILGAQRNLRILGIFARLCLRDGKPQYLGKMPRVWGHVQHCLEHPELAGIATLIRGATPEPTDDFLNDLKARCASLQTP